MSHLSPIMENLIIEGEQMMAIQNQLIKNLFYTNFIGIPIMFVIMTTILKFIVILKTLLFDYHTQQQQQQPQ